MSPKGGICAIFWDYENCPSPCTSSARETWSEIRSIAQKYGMIDTFNVYVESDKASAKLSELQSCGASPILCPPNGSKDTSDKVMIVDMTLKFAYNNPPPATIILISRDKDFVYALATLRLKGYYIVVVSRDKPSPDLAAEADKVYTLSNAPTSKVTQPTCQPPIRKQPGEPEAKKVQPPVEKRTSPPPTPKLTQPASEAPHGQKAEEKKPKAPTEKGTSPAPTPKVTRPAPEAPHGKEAGDKKPKASAEKGTSLPPTPKLTQPASEAPHGKEAKLKAPKDEKKSKG